MTVAARIPVTLDIGFPISLPCPRIPFLPADGTWHIIRRMCEKSSQDDCEECQQKQFLRTGVTIALSFWFINFVLAVFGWITDKGDTVASFGDSFGVVNSLFSSVAVAGAIYAVILQQRELRDTREEFQKQTKIHDQHLALLEKESADRERLLRLEYSPRLMLRDASHASQQIKATLINAGAPIYDLRVVSFKSPDEAAIKFSIGNSGLLDRHANAVVVWVFHHQLKHYPAGEYSFTLEFKTGLDEIHQKTFTIPWQMP